MNAGESRQFEQRLVRALAISGICYGSLFLLGRSVSGNLRSMFFSLVYSGRPEFPELMFLLYLAGFGLLFVSSIGLLRLNDWARRCFIIAAGIIIIGMVGTYAQQFAWAMNRYGTTQPSMFPSVREICLRLITATSDVVPPLLAIWVLRQPEVVKGTQPTTARGFDVLPRP